MQEQVGGEQMVRGGQGGGQMVRGGGQGGGADGERAGQVTLSKIWKLLHGQGAGETKQAPVYAPFPALTCRAARQPG